MKLVSFIMPTRNPWVGLKAALQSITNTCHDLKGIEILLRIDSDDHERIKWIPELEIVYGAECVVGPRGRGYVEMGAFVNDLVKIANSYWCWLFDDDAYVEGDWYTELLKVPINPQDGPAVNAENYVLGESHYKNGPNGGPVGLIVPTAFAKTLNHRNPVDQLWLDEIKSRGWTIQQLKGVSYYHDGRPRYI